MTELTLETWIAEATERLKRAGVDSPRLDAQLLAAFALDRDRSWVMAHPDAEVRTEDMERLLARRESREPLAYIVGKREFYGRSFFVDPAVLVPRQETEFLVERALLWLRSSPGPWTVLDIGTGSGCVGISIALEFPEAKVTLLDRSANALRVADKNARELGARVDFLHSDLFDSVPRGQSFRMVVSNPPYVAHHDDLPPEVREFEPTEALFAEGNGLAIYRRLAADAVARTGCEVLMVEIGQAQAEPVTAIFAEYGWEAVDALCDLAGIVRTLTFTPNHVE